MQRRLITPYADAPDLSAYEDREWDSAVDCKSVSEVDHSRCEIPAETLLYGYEGQSSCIQSLLCVQSSESLLKKAKMRAKRKPRRRSDSSGGYNLSDVIQSPPTAGQLTHVAY